MATQIKKERAEQIDRWAKYIQENPHIWREHHTRFLDDQLEMANAALRRIAKQPGGREKITQLRGITNKKVLDELCR